MKLYFAGAEGFKDKLYEWGARKILIAYPYFKDFLNNPKGENEFRNFDLFLDSGAWSVFTGTKKVDLDVMIEDLKPLDWIQLKCGLDVIGSAEQTKINCLKMRDAGLDIVPTFHYGEDWDYLDFYCKEFNYIAIGGIARIRQRKYLQVFLDQCWMRMQPYFSKIKVHGFALTAPWALQRYPFYSVDSTGWMGIRYGSVQENNGYAMINSKKRLFYLRNRDTDFVIQKNVHAYLELEKNITRLWEQKGVIWQK